MITFLHLTVPVLVAGTMRGEFTASADCEITRSGDTVRIRIPSAPVDVEVPWSLVRCAHVTRPAPAQQPLPRTAQQQRGKR